MKKLLLLAALALAARPAAAQQSAPGPAASHVQAAEQLLAASDAENAMRDGMRRMMDIQAQQNPALASMRDVLEEFFARYMGWERMKPEMVRVYTSTFSESEIRELTAFYRTDIGRKLAERMPEIMARSTEMSQRIVQEHMPELTQMIMERMRTDPESLRQGEVRVPSVDPSAEPVKEPARDR